MSVTTKVAAGAAAGVLSIFGGLVAAGALTGSTSGPVTNNTEMTATTPTVGHQSTEATEDHDRDTTTTTETSGVFAPKVVVTNTTCATNHGADVSAVARSNATTGEAHGDAVSAAAHDKCTNPKADSDTNEDTTAKADTETTETPEKPEVEADHDSSSAAFASHDSSDTESHSTTGDNHADTNPDSTSSH